ncbi:DUF6508 domain-containing protein [Pseudoalteromonas sp.]|uniref:DUF6508 domain-containing protein n=1 Tax=Pseudoalteromonas sp. TaxID=53249 RepID=UPI003001AFE7
MFSKSDVEKLEKDYRQAKEALPDIDHSGGYPKYPEVISKFMNAFCAPPWLKIDYDPREVKKIMSNIDNASPDNLCNVLTNANRIERFGDGQWALLLEGDFFPLVISRAYVLTNTNCSFKKGR